MSKILNWFSGIYGDYIMRWLQCTKKHFPSLMMLCPDSDHVINDDDSYIQKSPVRMCPNPRETLYVFSDRNEMIN